MSSLFLLDVYVPTTLGQNYTTNVGLTSLDEQTRDNFIRNNKTIFPQPLIKERVVSVSIDLLCQKMPSKTAVITQWNRQRLQLCGRRFESHA